MVKFTQMIKCVFVWTAMTCPGLRALPVNAITLKEADFNRSTERAQGLARLRSLLVSVDGELVVERYYHGTQPSDWANIKSVSKSIVSTLVGIALDRGHLNSVHTPIAKYFGSGIVGMDTEVRAAITIEDLLTMRSGLESTSNRNYGTWVQSGHWVRHVLNRPMVDSPGGRMIYSTGNSHLLSAILTKVTAMSTFEFTRRYLAEPLGIPLRPWMRDPQGIYFGGNEMHLTPRGMLKIGELYLNGGKANHRQVVSEKWIKETFEPRTRSRRSGREYGYGWWIDTLAGERSYHAWGYGGQFIFVVPGLSLVAVTTSLPSPGPERRAHRRAIYDLMEEEIVPATQRAARGDLRPSYSALSHAPRDLP